MPSNRLEYKQIEHLAVLAKMPSIIFVSLWLKSCCFLVDFILWVGARSQVTS